MSDIKTEVVEVNLATNQIEILLKAQQEAMLMGNYLAVSSISEMILQYIKLN